jgi:hypothetical protein
LNHKIHQNSLEKVQRENGAINQKIKKEAEKILNEALIIARWERNPFYIS